MKTNIERFALSIDGISKSDKLTDREYLENIVHGIIEICNMRLINDSSIISLNIPLELNKINKIPFEDEGGISILAGITTSHITLHVWPERKCFMFDLVSCKKYNWEKVVNYIKHTLQVSHVEIGMPRLWS